MTFMRVMHVIESLEFGGAEKVVIDLANAMSKEHYVVLCCVKRLGDLRKTVHDTVHVLCLEKTEGNDWRIPFRLCALVRQHRIDVLHSHNWGVFLEAAFAAFCCPRVGLVNTVHGPYMEYAPGWITRIKRNARHFLERIASSRHHRIVMVSEAIAGYLTTDIGIAVARTTTIMNGISSEEVLHLAGTHGAVRFLTVGRLSEVKNQAMMIRAFQDSNLEQAELWLVGDGPERLNLEQLVRDLDMDSRVRFLGFCQDVTTHLAQCDVFLMSSHYEGISIAVLEAMRAALPVLGTDVGGMRETVEHGVTGELVSPGDVGAFASAMRSFYLSRDKRIRMGNAGRARLLSVFSIENMVRQYKALYASAIPS